MKSVNREEELFHQLTYYTCSHPDPDFIHQHAVDAYAAQNADINTKPITLTFALVGLYLMIEKQFNGKQVQNAHIQMAKHRKKWPKFSLPSRRGDIRVQDVLKINPGHLRDEAIILWCSSVWEAYSKCHDQVAKIVRTELWGEVE